MAKNAVIGALRVNLGLDSAKFQTGLQQSGQSLGRFGAKANKEAKNITSAFGSMGAAVSKTFVSGIAVAATAALAPILSVAGALNGAKAALTEFDKIGKAAKAGGLDAEFYQELAHAAELGGVSTDQFSKALETFAKNAGLAVEGKGRMVAQLKVLNPELLKAIQNARTQEERIRLVADALQKETDASRKAAIAAAAFGDAGVRMVEMLKGGSAALDETARQARKLGLVVDRELIARAEELNDEFSTATRILDLQFKQALVNLAPIMVGIAERAARLAGDIRSVIDSMRDLENQGSQSLDGRMRSIGLERIEIENKILRLQDEQRNNQSALAQAENRLLDGTISALRDQLAALSAEEAKILKILADRKPAIAPLPTTPPITPPPGSGRRDKAAEAALKEAEAVKKLIDNLEYELWLVGQSDVQKRINNTLREAGSTLTEEQAIQIESLIRQIDAETEALKKNEEAQAARTQAIEGLFQMGGDALMSIVDGSMKAEDALKRLIVQLAQAALQAALLGSGPLAGLFGGMFGGGAKGFTNFEHAWTAAVPGLWASGGKVSGPGTGTSDSIPAMLSDGEYVVNARAAKKFGPLLEAINSGAIAGFKHGGWVMPPMSERGPELIIRGNV